MLQLPQTLDELAQQLGVTQRDLRQFSFKVETLFVEVLEPKKNGGVRVIRKPFKQLKIFLRQLNKILTNIPEHNFIYNKKGSSYIKLIKEHLSSPYILTADIDDFFPNVTPTIVHKQLLKLGFNNKIALLITRLTTVRYSLPQGFPTSSTIAALILEPALNRLDILSKRNKIKVGIYADNLVLGANYNLKKFRGLISKIFRQNSFKLEQFEIMGPNDKRELMDIILGKNAKVKREFLRETRRDIFILQKIEDSKVKVKAKRSLRGKLSHVKQVNLNQANKLHREMKKILCEN